MIEEQSLQNKLLEGQGKMKSGFEIFFKSGFKEILKVNFKIIF